MAAEKKGGMGIGTVICAVVFVVGWHMYSDGWIWDDVQQWLRSPNISALSKPPTSATKPKPPPDRAPPHDTLTIDNFPARFASPPFIDGITVGPFNCSPDRTNSAFVICMNNVRQASAGANMVLKGSTSTRVLTFAGISIANPEMFGGVDRERLAKLYLLLSLRLVSTLSPDLRPDAALALLSHLQANLERNPNERRVGQWVYGAGTGLLLVFVAERK